MNAGLRFVSVKHFPNILLDATMLECFAGFPTLLSYQQSVYNLGFQNGLDCWWKANPIETPVGRWKKKLETNSKLWRAALFSRWCAVRQTNVGQQCCQVRMYHRCTNLRIDIKRKTDTRKQVVDHWSVCEILRTYKHQAQQWFEFEEKH